MSNNKTAIDPHGLAQSEGVTNNDDLEFFKQFEDFLTRYYIGISDFCGKGLLVDQGLPWRIEKQLTLKGKVLVLEMKVEEERQLFLADITGKLERNLDKQITRVEFIIIDDEDKPNYTARRVIEVDKKIGKEIDKGLVIFNRKGEEDLLFNPARMVLFINNGSGSADQKGIRFWLKRLKKRLDYIDYDAKRCRKKMAVFTPSTMDGNDKKEAIEGVENDDYIFNIAFGKSMEGGKGKGEPFDSSDVNFSTIGVQNSNERPQLWSDYKEYILQLAHFHGVMLSPSFKQERQNIPETMALEAPYKAWEKERKQVREESYRQCEELGWIEEGWELNYGVQSETNEQKIKKVEEEIKLLELEEQLAELKQRRSLSQEEKKIEKKGTEKSEEQKKSQVIYERKK